MELVCSYAGAVSKGEGGATGVACRFLDKSVEKWKKMKEAAAVLSTHSSGIPSSPPTWAGIK